MQIQGYPILLNIVEDHQEIVNSFEIESLMHQRIDQDFQHTQIPIAFDQLAYQIPAMTCQMFQELVQKAEVITKYLKSKDRKACIFVNLLDRS